MWAGPFSSIHCQVSSLDVQSCIYWQQLAARHQNDQQHTTSSPLTAPGYVHVIHSIMRAGYVAMPVIWYDTGTAILFHNGIVYVISRGILMGDWAVCFLMFHSSPYHYVSGEQYTCDGSWQSCYNSMLKLPLFTHFPTMKEKFMISNFCLVTPLYPPDSTSMWMHALLVYW